MTNYYQEFRVYVSPWVEVTSATGSSTGTTYTIKTGKVVPYAVGDVVRIEGFTNTAFNIDNTVVTNVTSTTFKVSGGPTSGTASAFTPGNAGLTFSLQTSAGYTYDFAAALSDIGSLQIRGGRADITAQPEPMTASIDILWDSSTTFTPALNQLMIVEVYDQPSTTYKRLFVGGLSDITVSTDAWFNGQGLYRYSLQAASMFQKFQFRVAQYTSSSIICLAGYGPADWLTASLGNNPDVNGWFAGSSTFVDTSGVVMHKRAAGYYYDYDIASSAANTARGNLYDAPDGRIYYTQFSASLTPSFYALTQAKIMASGISATKSITDVYNNISVTSSNTAISSGSAADTTSQQAFGRRRGSKDTEADAQTVVDSYASHLLAVRKSPKWRYGAITIDLANPELTDADRQYLYGTRTNYPYELALPTQLGGTTQVLVDNWSWSFSRNRATLTMQVCPFTDLHP